MEVSPLRLHLDYLPDVTSARQLARDVAEPVGRSLLGAISPAEAGAAAALSVAKVTGVRLRLRRLRFGALGGWADAVDGAKAAWAPQLLEQLPQTVLALPGIRNLARLSAAVKAFALAPLRPAPIHALSVSREGLARAVASESLGIVSKGFAAGRLAAEAAAWALASLPESETYTPYLQYPQAAAEHTARGLGRASALAGRASEYLDEGSSSGSSSAAATAAAAAGGGGGMARAAADAGRHGR